ESLRCSSAVGQGSNEIQEAEKQQLERKQHRRKDEGERGNPIFAGGGRTKIKTKEKTKTEEKTTNTNQNQPNVGVGWKGDPVEIFSVSFCKEKPSEKMTEKIEKTEANQKTKNKNDGRETLRKIFQLRFLVRK